MKRVLLVAAASLLLTCAAPATSPAAVNVAALYPLVCDPVAELCNKISRFGGTSGPTCSRRGSTKPKEPGR